MGIVTAWKYNDAGFVKPQELTIRRWMSMVSKIKYIIYNLKISLPVFLSYVSISLKLQHAPFNLINLKLQHTPEHLNF